MNSSTNTAPVGTSGNASYVNPFSPTTGMVTAGTPSTIQTGINNAKVQAANIQAGINSLKNTPQSTTTLSSDKTTDVNNIQNKTQQLSQTGVTTDPATGVATYANGSIYNPPQPEDSSDKSQQGGYYGDQYITPGSPIPKDANGNEVTLTSLPPSVQANNDSYQALMARSDAQTASMISSIQGQYQQLIQQQQQANTANQAGETAFLLRNGGLQHTASGGNVINAEINYGLQQLADLTNKEQMAIVQAQQAGLDEDFQLQSKINDNIEQIRQEKTAILTKQADDLATQNQKLADEKLQSSKDAFVASQMSQGITDPAQILANAQAQGFTTLTSSDISDSLANINPNTAAVVTLATKYPDAGILSTDSIGQANAKILNSPSYTAEQKSVALDNAYKQSEIAKNNASIGTSSNGVNVSGPNGQQASIPADVVPYYNVSNSGVPYVDASSLQGTAADKTSIIQQATAAGLKVITNKNEAADLTNIEDANAKLDTISTIMAGIGQPNALSRALGGAGLTKLATLTESDPQKAAAGALQSVGLDILKAISGIQGFRGNSTVVQQINDHMPTIYDTVDTANQKIDYIRQLIDDRENSILGTPQNPGPDLSIYQDGGTGQPVSNGIDLSKFNQ